MSKKFVIIVDTQNDFMKSDGALYVPGAEDIIDPLGEYLRSLNPKEVEGVLFTLDTHYADTYPQSEEAKEFPIHCVVGTEGWRNVCSIEDINSKIPVYTLHKTVFDMWADEGATVNDTAKEGIGSDRDYFFKKLLEDGTLDVEVAGVALNYCVAQAIEGLAENGFKIHLKENLTKAIDNGKPGFNDPRVLFAKLIENNQLVIE